MSAQKFLDIRTTSTRSSPSSLNGERAGVMGETVRSILKGRKPCPRFIATITLLLLYCGPGCEEKPPARPLDFSQANSVAAIFGDRIVEKGLHLVETGKNSPSTRSDKAGVKCRRFRKSGTNEIYIPFAVDSSFKLTALTNVDLTV